MAHSLRFFAVTVVVAAGFFVAAPRANAAVSDNLQGWAWSASVGWISMNCTNLGTCPPGAGTVDYGVTLKNVTGVPGRADVSGWAWAETVGWICFGATCTATPPEGGSSYAQYRAVWGGKNDEIYGWAQIVAYGASGWISLNCDRDNNAFDTCGTSNFHLVLDDANGYLTFGQLNDHWGWGGADDGAGPGWVDFSAVTTSWVTSAIGTVRRPQGVFEPQNAGLPGTHPSTFPITFSGFSGAIGQLLECEVLLPDNSRRVISQVLTSTVRNGTTNILYTIRNSDDVQRNSLWYVTKCTLAGFKRAPPVCANDAACGAGKICDDGIGAPSTWRCRDVLDSTARMVPVYTHENQWTGLDAQEDQYLAIKCNAGFPSNYFNNAAQCDFTGDASFALAMRRGIIIEGNCGDGIDNDGNGQIDCADRYCKGISYLCQTLPRTSCVWGQTGDNLGDCSSGSYATGQLCCTRQPNQAQPSLQNIVDGLECTYGEPDDGYYDCDCVGAARFNASPNDDCAAPGYQNGDLCCTASNDVVKQ